MPASTRSTIRPAVPAARVTLLLVALQLPPAPGLAQESAPPAVDGSIAIRVYGVSAVRDSTLARMRANAARVLGAAGVPTRWLECAPTGAEAACLEPAGRHVIIVRFLENAAETPRTCGHAVRALRPSGGLISVHLPCVAAVVASMRAQLGNPTLAWLEEGHVLGAILVHEVGHLLGEDHTPAGIMRPILRLVEWERLLRHDLNFSPRQARALRAAARAVLDGQMADRR